MTSHTTAKSTAGLEWGVPGITYRTVFTRRSSVVVLRTTNALATIASAFPVADQLERLRGKIVKNRGSQHSNFALKNWYKVAYQSE